MTESKTDSFRIGSRCRICTGCGRCFGTAKMDAVSSFFSFEREDTGRRAGKEKGASLECANIICADIGTTTIAMQLRSIKDGSIRDTFTCLNPQRKYGADVLSRIEAAKDKAVKEQMTQEVREALSQGVLQFQNTLRQKLQDGKEQKKVRESENRQAEICGMVIAANTTMVHLLMGYEVSSLGSYPFTPYTLAEIRTRLCGLKTIILPGISTFIGADLMAGIQALSMDKREEITLLLDLGTNGEMVLGNRRRLLCTAVAAGPAFEGGTEAYGADLMALTAKLLAEGILDSTGLLSEPYFEEGVLIGNVRITQQYIRQLQMAKAAVCTGVHLLCKKYGIKNPGQIDRVFLAGGMGCYLDPVAAAGIGLFPAVFAEKAVAVGNAALEGSFVYGRQAFRRDEKERPVMRTKAEVFNLAEEKDFQEYYISNMELSARRFI